MPANDGTPSLLNLTVASRTLLFLINFYQWTLGYFLGGRCRFVPTCSCYGKEAIQRYGAGAGFKLIMQRLLRCQPFAAGGYDPVPSSSLTGRHC